MSEHFDRALAEHAPLLDQNPPLNHAIGHVDACIALAKGILIRNRVHEFQAADVVAVAEMIAAREKDEIGQQQV